MVRTGVMGYAGGTRGYAGVRGIRGGTRGYEGVRGGTRWYEVVRGVGTLMCTRVACVPGYDVCTIITITPLYHIWPR